MKCCCVHRSSVRAPLPLAHSHLNSNEEFSVTRAFDATGSQCAPKLHMVSHVPRGLLSIFHLPSFGRWHFIVDSLSHGAQVSLWKSKLCPSDPLNFAVSIVSRHM